jgi:hypothetical protein
MVEHDQQRQLLTGRTMSRPDAIRDVWIRSEPDEKGYYHVHVEVGKDRTYPMDGPTAYAWAREVLSAVAAAEYDAAVLKQMLDLGTDDEGAALMVTELRVDRAAEVPLSMIPGLAMRPGVSQRTRQGFLTLVLDGEPVGQWEMNDARQHALALLMAIEVAVLDGAYLRALEKTGLERKLALHAISELGKHREADND